MDFSKFFSDVKKIISVRGTRESLGKTISETGAVSEGVEVVLIDESGAKKVVQHHSISTCDNGHRLVSSEELAGRCHCGKVLCRNCSCNCFYGHVVCREHAYEITIKGVKSYYCGKCLWKGLIRWLFTLP